MTLRPDIAVAAIVERAGRFLVVEERIQRRLVLNQPAGRVEEGENPIDAVIRETREETAWGFDPEYLLGIYFWRNPANGQTTVRLAFTGPVSDYRHDQPLDHGIERAHWLTRDELLLEAARLRSPLVIRCVDDYVEGRRLPLESIACLGLDLPRANVVTLDEVTRRHGELAR